jgi:hypothetical protein
VDPNASHALSDLKRLYFVARPDLPLEDLLEFFDRGQARAVKQHYRAEVFDTFADYEEISSVARVSSMSVFSRLSSFDAMK